MEKENKQEVNIQHGSAKANVRCRADIKREIDEKLKLIDKLREQILELKREDALFSDEKQWYTEEYEEHIVSNDQLKERNF